MSKKSTDKIKDVKPLGDRVLVKPLEEKEVEKKSESGIILPDSSKEEAAKRGEVVAVGPGRRNDSGEVVPIDLKGGEKILFKEFSGEKVNIDDEEHYIVNEDGILAVIG